MKGLSATTTATASPAYRTTSRASGGYAGVFRFAFGIAHAVMMFADLVLHILGCEDIEDSGKASCLRRVDRTDSRMRIGTSDELCENGPGREHVRHEIASAGEEPVVFLAEDGLAEHLRRLGHGLTLPRPHHLTRGRDGVDNARIPGAAADVPRYRGPNSVFRRCVFHLEELESREHDPGSAEPALETVVCLERLLIGWSRPCSERPSIVVIFRPSAWTRASCTI